MNIRTRILRVCGALLAVLVIGGFTAPLPASPGSQASVDEAVRTVLDDEGLAPIIVRMREQADVSELATAADAAARSVLADVLDVDALLGGGDVGTDRHGLDSLGSSDVVADLTQSARASTVVDGLQQVATAGTIDELLDDGRTAGALSDVTEFWIFNGFAATVDEAALETLRAHPDVESIVLDEEIELADTNTSDLLTRTTELAGLGMLAAEQPVSWGVERVGAPQAWSSYETRGEGAVVGIMDSGVDGSHPSLSGSWRGASGDPKKSWFVATGENYPAPGDGRGHGTHIAGTVVGETDDRQTGIAPDAEWIAAKIFSDSGRTNVSTIHRGFEWMLAPGGDPSAAPDVVNNSWGTSSVNSREFWQDIDAWIAAGIVPVFAVGNRGPRSGSLSSPASFPHVVAVGATDSRDNVVRFSSRGPVTWNGTSHVKPDLTAPGYRIRSAWPTQRGGGYRLMSGTSMAAPHVAGVAALVRSANPGASVADVRAALESSAEAVSTAGALPDNAFGHGIVNAPAALKRAAVDR